MIRNLFSLILTLCAALPATAQTVLRVSDSITLTRISPHAWVHTSLADLGDFKGVSSNGMVVIDGGEALLLDTPANDAQTETLVRFIADSLHARVTQFMPNHWHADCMGGLRWLQTQGVAAYANRLTVEAARREGKPVPEHAFARSKTLKVGNIQVECHYEGGGHSVDNTVAWVPSEKVLFGGCLVKDIKTTGLGNTADTDMEAWPVTMRKMCDKYRDAQIVVPGHGPWGDAELLTHTLKLVSAAPEQHKK